LAAVLKSHYSFIFMYYPLAKKILASLPERNREVLVRRYGFSGEPETLEAIGDDYEITRERVRQLENAAFERLSANGSKEDAETAFKTLAKHLEEHGQLRREERFLEEIASPKERPAVLFLLELGDYFGRHRETEHRHTVWATSKDAVSDAEAFNKTFARHLTDTFREALDEKSFWKEVEAYARAQGLRAEEKALRSWIDASKLVGQGPLGMWGLVDWADVSPKGAGDRAWLVFKKEGKPLHFEDLAELINKKYFNDEDTRPVHMQTVHNELIKDDRFVLVGRGMYGLADWGYAAGTVKDVIVSILKKANKPMRKEDVLAQVFEQRMVKPATVLLGLSDRKKFVRTPDGRYSLRA